MAREPLLSRLAPCRVESVCEELGVFRTNRALSIHDNAPAARAKVPEPAEVKDDIDKLDELLAAIRRRRR